MFEFQYYVVEFQTPVHSTVPRYVCVPSSWIRSHVEKKAAISFPNEPYQATVEKIVLGKPYEEKWGVQMATIKSGYDNLNEAQKKAIDMCIGVPEIMEKSDNVTPSNKRDESNVNEKTPQKGKKRKVEIPDDATTSKYFKPGDLPKQNEAKEKTKTPQKSRDQMIQHEKIEREKQILKKLARVFENMQESFEEMSDTLSTMQDTVCVIKKNLSKTAEMSINLLKCDNNKQPSIQIATTENEPRRSNRSLREEPQGFVFPDNTDKSFKWTLRHQTLTEDLIELLPKSGVYVRHSELEKLDSETDSPSEAALLVMKEIFSDEALRVCSLSGRGNRPPLDKYSRKVLIMYLNEYCNSRRWKTDEISIWTFLRRKLAEFRTN